MYQDIPKKKKRDRCISTSDKNEIKKVDEKLTKIKEEITLENLKIKKLDFFVANYPSIVAEYSNQETYKKMKEEFKHKIEMDVKEAYFGNVEKLKNICEINDLPFNETNLS